MDSKELAEAIKTLNLQHSLLSSLLSEIMLTIMVETKRGSLVSSETLLNHLEQWAKRKLNIENLH